MVPRHVYRLGILAISLAFITFSAINLAHTNSVTHGQNQGISKGYCASDPSGPVVYFSGIFDVKRTGYGFDTNPLSNAFGDFLKAMYDYKTNSNYPAGCPIGDTLSQAEASKQQLESQVRQAGNQIVEVDWKPGEGVVPFQSGRQHDLTAMGPAPHLSRYTWCRSQTYENTIYFSGLFDTTAFPNNQWSNPFTQFLTKKYPFKGRVDCYTLGLADGQRTLKARIDAARASSRVIETEWKYDPTMVVNTPARPAPSDNDDREPLPAQQRPAQSPSGDARQFAAKEIPVTLAYCHHDRVMAGAFDCYCVQHMVHNYRLQHENEVAPGIQPEALANLFSEDKIEASQCISDYRVKMWAKSEAQSRARLKPDQADCVAQRFLSSLHAKPYPGRADSIFNGAVAACR